MKCLCAFLFLLSCSCTIWAQQKENIYDEDHSIRFAGHLFQRKDFAMAAGEYEHVLFFQPKDSFFHHRLLISYLKSSQFNTGIKRGNELYPSLTSMPPDIAFTLGKTYLMAERYEALTYLFLGEKSSLKPSDKAYLSIGNNLINRNWEEAQSIFSQQDPKSKIAELYRPIVQRTESVAYKKAWVGGVLSAIIPGTGKIYAKQWKDGVIGLLFVGSLAFSTYRQFNRGGTDNWLTFVYGGLTLGFYAGNVFGSWKAVKRYNQRIDNEIIQQTKARIYSRL
ncbi:MAG: hypothetical protein AAFY71_15840 [Bacteroidota bacterium]